MAGPVAETPAVVEAPAPVAVAVTEVPAAPPPEPARRAHGRAKSRGHHSRQPHCYGTVALTLILVVLISGVWFYGNHFSLT